MSAEGPTIEPRGREVVIYGVEPFDLTQTLDSGQAFRWAAGRDVFTGVVRGRVVRIRQEGRDLVLLEPTDDEGVRMVVRYFSLDTDHAAIERRLAETDEWLARAVAAFPGLRLLRQDPWECLISFILSARNAIPLIRRAIERIASTYGDPIAPDGPPGGEAPSFFAFPTAGQLACANVVDLVKCGAGFRSQYVKAAAERVASGDLNLATLKGLGYERAKARLMELRGVGDKIAGCVLLFSFEFHEAFPIDVWMTRIMRHVYFNGARVSPATIAEFARERFGELAGYAQQYLFHYARKELADEIRHLD